MRLVQTPLMLFFAGFLILVIGFAQRVSATPWGELEPGTVTRLKDGLKVLPDFSIPKGSTLALNSNEVLSPLQVQLFQFRLFPCLPDLQFRRIPLMILNQDYGFELDLNCKISFFVELRNYYDESYFDSVMP